MTSTVTHTPKAGAKLTGTEYESATHHVVSIHASDVGPETVVAASNAPAAIRASADYVCNGTNDAAQIQAAIDALPAAGGTVVLSVGTFNLIGQGSITTDSLTQAYCVKITASHGAVILQGQGIGATVLKLANSQATNTIPILVRGSDASPRTSPTLLTRFEVQGNTANQPAWSDFGLIEMAYAQQTALDLVKISDAPWFLLQNFRKSTDTRLARCTFISAGANNQVRFETSNFIVTESRFEGVNGATSGSALSLSPNDDIGSFLAQDGRIFANVFLYGYRAVSISGGNGNIIADNMILMGAPDPTSEAIRLEHFTATLNFSPTDNIITGNKIYNPGTGIRLTSTTTYGAKHNIVAHNIIVPDGSTFYGIREDGASADNNRIIDNEIDGSTFTADYATVGANTVVRKANFGTSSAAIGTSSAGTSQNPARSDHVHATGAGTPSTQAFGDAATTGSGPAAAMTDHKHGMPAAPTAASVGAAATVHTHVESDVTSLTTDLAAKLASADYRTPVEDPTFELSGASRMTLAGTSELFFATNDRQFRMSAAYAQSITVPNGYWRLHYRELQLVAANRLTCNGTSDFVLTDLGAPAGRLTLAGRF